MTGILPSYSRICAFKKRQRDYRSLRKALPLDMRPGRVFIYQVSLRRLPTSQASRWCVYVSWRFQVFDVLMRYVTRTVYMACAISSRSVRANTILVLCDGKVLMNS